MSTPAKSLAGRQLQLRFGACHLKSVSATLDDLPLGQQEYVDQYCSPGLLHKS
jgi:hypothetical protein